MIPALVTIISLYCVTRLSVLPFTLDCAACRSGDCVQRVIRRGNCVMVVHDAAGPA